MSINKQTRKIGDCEIRGEHVNVEVFLEEHGIWMCQECRDEEERLTKRNQEAREVIENAHRVDSFVELKQDVFNAGTIPFIELQAAINQNTDIPADRKFYALAKECELRIEKLNAAIFADEAALMAKKNERQAWKVNGQVIVSKIREEKERAEFKQFDIKFEVKTQKEKPKAVKPKTKKVDMEEVKKYALQYHVDVTAVRMLMVSKNMTAENAAKYMMELMGGTK